MSHAAVMGWSDEGWELVDPVTVCRVAPPTTDAAAQWDPGGRLRVTGVVPVSYQAPERVLLGLGDRDATVALVELEGRHGPAVSEKIERVALPHVVLPPVVGQLDTAEPCCQAAQSTACVDGRQLRGVASQDELPRE